MPVSTEIPGKIADPKYRMSNTQRVPEYRILKDEGKSAGNCFSLWPSMFDIRHSTFAFRALSAVSGFPRTGQAW
jgi:hypothetical protein